MQVERNTKQTGLFLLPEDSYIHYYNRDNYFFTRPPVIHVRT
jgi:hypothetical protein